jgi:hypothetical protein
MARAAAARILPLCRTARHERHMHMRGTRAARKPLTHATSVPIGITPDRAHMPPGIAAEPGAACRRAAVRTRWSRHCQFGRPTGCAVTTRPTGVRRRRTGPGADFSF